MATGLVLSLRPEVSVSHEAPDKITLAASATRVVLKTITPAVGEALRMLSSTGATEDDLNRLVGRADGGLELSRFHYRLRNWERLGLLRRSLTVDGQQIATVVLMSSGLVSDERVVDAGTRVQLSRFAYCRRAGEEMVVESPLSATCATFHDGPYFGLLADLTRPRSAADLHATHDELAVETILELVRLLVDSGFAVVQDDGGGLAEDHDPSLAGWEFHDLLFHSRSRRGRHNYPIGATYPGAGRADPLPAVKPPMTDHGIPLFLPDLSHFTAHDPPLGLVMERRRSVRRHGREPITVRELGEFLYRVARVRRTLDPDPRSDLPYPASDRPCPSGGAAHDLELYLTVDRCAGLLPGSYHYDPLGHQLHKLADLDGTGKALLEDARAAAAMSASPQILLTLTSRFGRLSWKYSGLAYALALKNAGVLIHAMYLVATATGLAGCALGSGDSDRFAAATEVDRFAEPPVGEFILGSRPEQ